MAGLLDVALTPVKAILGEDATASLPILGPLAGAKTDEYKALIKKQEQMAREAAARRQQQHQQGLNSLSQGLAAFGPRNQMMAQMFGPDAAFTPQQISAMGADPAGPPKPWEVDISSKGQRIDTLMGATPEQVGPMSVSVEGYTGTDPKVQAEVEKYLAQLKEYNAQEARRRQMIERSVGPVGPGPAPIRMPAPQRGRR